MSDVANMTDEELEVAAFPPASLPGSRFPEARAEGYDVGAVDTFIDNQRSRVEQARTAAKAARADAATLRDEVSRLTARLGESERPTFAGLGWHATDLLEKAEAKADAILAEANQVANDIAQLAERDADELRADTAPRVDPGRDVEKQRSNLYADAEQDRKSAKHDAEKLVATARKAADKVRADAEARASKIRDAANADADKARDDADQEVTAGRRVLALEQERAASESAEAHRSAVELAEQLAAATEARVASAEVRARETLEAAAHVAEWSKAESEQLLVDAQRRAEQAGRAAQVDAEAALGPVDTEDDHELIKARADLIYYQRRYHVIAAQLTQLHDSAHEDGAEVGPEGRSQAGPATTVEPADQPR